MFVILSKILPIFIFPVGLVCLLIVLAIFLRSRTSWQTAVLVAALLLLLVSSSGWGAAAITKSLEWQYLPPEEFPPHEVIVVLGGGGRPAEYPRQISEMNEAGDRMLYAAWLYANGVAPKLLVSGGTLDWLGGEIPESQRMVEILGMMGVPADAIITESEARNTYENAVYTRDLLAPLGIDRIVLVTSASHMPRSVALYEKQGFEVLPAPTDFQVTYAGWRNLHTTNPAAQLVNLLPSAGNLELTTRALKEYVGILTYWLRGWL
ncbi:MAG: YdcF family protein [Caldilineaceae bacterium]|nr:YdcF family protein [Caldilineaceae bacterium]